MPVSRLAYLFLAGYLDYFYRPPCSRNSAKASVEEKEVNYFHDIIEFKPEFYHILKAFIGFAFP